MADPIHIATPATQIAHRETVCLGSVAEAPPNENSALNVIVQGYTSEFDYLVPAGNWTPRGSAMPTPGSPCLVAFDENGECWVPIWHGVTTFPTVLHPFLMIGD